jgi:hypothetical protein
MFQIATNQTVSNNANICKVPNGWGLINNLSQQWFVGTCSNGYDIVSRVSFDNNYTFRNISIKGDIISLFCSGCYISE